MTGKIKDNIKFFSKYNDEKYKAILESCCLIDDLKNQQEGDETKLDEGGVNLSGGQQQRISIARCAYYDADIYLFDDPLSAVDPEVSNNIFDRLLSSSNGYLKSK
ncbi:MAG: Canalicular multispecific organic anion transporter 1, partial [Paramarteilia canceri]